MVQLLFFRTTELTVSGIDQQSCWHDPVTSTSMPYALSVYSIIVIIVVVYGHPPSVPHVFKHVSLLVCFI